MLVVGGLGEHTLTEIYDPDSGSWSAGGDLNAARYQHTAAALGDGTVMITGGLEGGQEGGRSNTSEIYDPETDTWLAVGPLPEEEEASSRSPTGRGRLLALYQSGAAGLNSGGPDRRT